MIVGLPEEDLNSNALNFLPEAEFGDDETDLNIEHIISIEKTEKIQTTTQLPNKITLITKFPTTTKEPFKTLLETINTTIVVESTTTNNTLIKKKINEKNSIDAPLAVSSIPALDLKNLPTLFNLIKQLTVIPNLVRSFSENTPNTIATATNLNGLYSGNHPFLNS